MPLQAERTELCIALPKLNVRVHGLLPSIVLIVFRFSVASSSERPPDRNRMPEGQMKFPAIFGE